MFSVSTFIGSIAQETVPDQNPHGFSHIDSLRADQGAGLALLAEFEKRTAGRGWEIVPLEKAHDLARTFATKK
jgi:hypothetical protein